MAKEANEKESYTGLVSFIFGFMSILFSIQLPLGSIVGLLLAIMGLIFGLVQLSKKRNSWAIWGIVFSVIGAIVNIAVFIILAQILSKVVLKMQELQASGLLSGQIPPIPQ